LFHGALPPLIGTRRLAFALPPARNHAAMVRAKLADTLGEVAPFTWNPFARKRMPKMEPMNDWEVAAAENGWEMPPAPKWKRLPIIRHVRAIWLSQQVARHNYFYGQIGLAPTGYDEWVCAGIWQGKERGL
jgi:hypothetical protein